MKNIMQNQEAIHESNTRNTNGTEEGNKPQKYALSLIETKTYTPIDGSEYYSSGTDWVSWGTYNEYPGYIWDNYMQCGTLQSIINGCSDFTYGNGILNNTGIIDENEFGDTIEDIVDKICLDRWIFGGFALQVKYNKLGEVISLSHIDLRKCRISHDGKFVFVKNKWNSGNSDFNKYHSFDPETGAADGVQIYFYKGMKTRGIYPVCDYVAALVSCETQSKIQQFNYNELDNNFMCSGIVNFNNGIPTEKVQVEIENKVNKKFSGYKNAARMMVSFNEDKDSAVSFERLSTDDFPDRYKSCYETSRADIFISLSAHPQLFGMTVQSGFSDIDYQTAFSLLNNTHIRKKQGEIKRVFKKIFNREDAIEFKPFNPIRNEESSE